MWRTSVERVGSVAQGNRLQSTDMRLLIFALTDHCVYLLQFPLRQGELMQANALVFHLYHSGVTISFI